MKRFFQSLLPVLPKNRQKLIILLPVFVVAYIVLALICHQKMDEYAISEARKSALDVLLNHKAVHRYVAEIQRPEIYRLQGEGKLYKEYFSPKVMSFTFIARNIKELLGQERKKAGLQPLYFKLATDNPRNPINQADAHESALLAKMKNGDLKEYNEVVQQDGVPTLHVAIPVDRSSKGCLKCHNDPASAPAELLASYGDVRGFHEGENSIRALISIRVPLTQYFHEANQTAWMILTIALLVLMLIYGLIYYFILVIDREQQAVIASGHAKSNFLATMSHEIRTPMNGILGMAQLLMIPTLQENERLDYARILFNSGQTLLGLLNDILDASKIDAGKLELTPVNFSPQTVLEEIHALFNEMARQKGLELRIAWQGPPTQRYQADAIRLRQMISNLVTNAIKFTNSGSISVHAVELERTATDAMLQFSVTDTGIGIPKEQQSLLFQTFSQLGGTQASHITGTGLGLSIVRSIATAMGGSVGIDSDGHGSTFWIRVRVRVVTPVAEHQPVVPVSIQLEPQAVAAGRTIMVVEDNVINRKVIEVMLAKAGATVTCTENGQQAVDMIARGTVFDLIFMDCRMPVMNGLQATKLIRQWEQDNKSGHVPIIALTAGVFSDDRQACIGAGMDDFLAKPVDRANIMETLTKWIKAAEQGK
jgi:signal transduction histidine kinase/CheY-like chemotaxis protein